MKRLLAFFIVFAVLRIPLAAQRHFFFGPVRTDLTAYSPSAVVTADFNADGIADLAMTDQNGVLIYLGTGDGNFAKSRLIPILSGPNAYNALTVSDINSDGKPDLVIFDGSENAVVLFNDGDAKFTPGPVFQQPVGGAFNQIFAADFNGDGHPDIALGGSSGINIFLGHGDGTFAAPVFLPVEGDLCIAIADVNGDGKPDALACGVDPQMYGAVVAFLGNGDGTFQPPIYSQTQYEPSFLAAGDFNGDGKADLAGISSQPLNSPAPAYLLIGEGNGKFHPPAPLNPEQGPLLSLAVGDVNGDGLPDVVATGLISSMAVMLNQGGGVFKLAGSYPVTVNQYYPDTTFIGDLNGDGIADIAIANFSGNRFSILFGLGAGEFLDNRTFGIPNQGFPAFVPVAEADFNRDGIDDFAVVLATPSLQYSLSIYYGTGEAEQAFRAGPATPSDPALCAVSGDFNGDGILDVAISSPLGQYGELRTYLGKGDGTFTAAPASTLPQAIVIAKADFNGDGILDIAGSSGYLALGKGDGTFGPPQQFQNINQFGLSPGVWVGAADLNHDGKADLVFVTPVVGNQFVTILLGNGDGTFQKPTSYSLEGEPIWCVIGDFNGDGIPDIATSNVKPGLVSPQISILLGKGDGTFQVSEIHGSGGLQTQILVARDFNGDGNLDLAVLDPAGDGIFIFPGNGDGTFSKQVYVPGGVAMSFLLGGNFQGQKGSGFADLVTLNGSDNHQTSSGYGSALSLFFNKRGAK